MHGRDAYNIFCSTILFSWQGFIASPLIAYDEALSLTIPIFYFCTANIALKHYSLNEAEIDESPLTDGIVKGGRCLSVRHISPHSIWRMEFGTKVRVAVVFLMFVEDSIGSSTFVRIKVGGGEYAIYVSTLNDVKHRYQITGDMSELILKPEVCEF